MSNKQFNNKELSQDELEELFEILKDRFEKNMHRHQNLEWSEVLAKLQANMPKAWSLSQMEKTGGEPDVINYNEKTDELSFCDCSEESPDGRRNTCYDQEAQESRKENKPKNNAIDMADEMGAELLTEEQYKELQNHGNFDSNTSSWLKTDSEIREMGGALFADFRYGKTFVYHNGASSYYAVRGFRCLLRV